MHAKPQFCKSLIISLIDDLHETAKFRYAERNNNS